MNTWPRRQPSPRVAFTLIELVVTITVLAVVSAIAVGIFVESGRALSGARNRNNGFEDAQYALNRLDVDLSGLANRSQVTSMQSNAITLDISGSDLTYALSGSTLLRDGEVLARNVTQFALTYYQSDGSIATQASDLHRIGANITVSHGGNPAPLRLEIFPRAFRNVETPPGADPIDTGIDGRGGRRWWWLGRLWRWTRRRHW